MVGEASISRKLSEEHHLWALAGLENGRFWAESRVALSMLKVSDGVGCDAVTPTA